jgi:ribose transport system ATP-binding protein
MGENGAGKSTLMKILAGAYQADSGEIILDGKPVHLRTPHEARLAGIGIIYQELTVART